MFGQTVTVFSKQGDTWYPRVFHDTQVARDRGYITRVYGETANETVSVHVKKKGYLAEGLYTVYEPKAWAALVSVSGAVSFKPGDVLWEGDYATIDEHLAPIPDNTYPKGFYSYMRGAYDCVYAITQAAVYETLPHWEIGGR